MDQDFSLDQFVNRMAGLFTTPEAGPDQYAGVWLREELYGGLYRDERYNIIVQAKVPVESKMQEGVRLMRYIWEQLPSEQRRHLGFVRILQPGERMDHDPDDIAVPLAAAA